MLLSLLSHKLQFLKRNVLSLNSQANLEIPLCLNQLKTNLPMSMLSRRHFLQFAGATLGTLGLSKLERYGKVLAHSTPRKVALLVGINDYSEGVGPLKGCVNDVFMQRELLIHRFGFNPKDIHLLLDQDATREGMLGAFEEYLIKGVKPGDIAVYHYSGHGSRVSDPNPIFTGTRGGDDLNGTFVPIDSTFSQDEPEKVKDIMGHTLYLLMSAVPTENFTAVLDSCFSGGAKRIARIRSRNEPTEGVVSSEEKSYQEKWLGKLDLAPEEFIAGYRRGVAKGVVIASTDPNQYAADATLNGFSAGAFTYAFTQYLWQEDTTPEKAVAHAINDIQERNLGFDQTPTLEAEVNSNYEKQPIYLTPTTKRAAHAVVTRVEGKQAKFWLGGIDPGEVDLGMYFSVSGKDALVRYRSRNGLLAIGKVVGDVSPGDLLMLDNG